MSSFSVIDALVSMFCGNPLVLVFFVSIGGNVIPFLPTPAMLVIVALVTAPASALTGIGLIQIAAIAALGASLGKFVSYGLGYGARRALGKDQRFNSFRNRLGGSTFLVALMFAASPLVDAAFIPLGIMRYSTWKSFLSLYTGKFIWILSVLYVARTSHQIIIDAVGADLYAAIFSICLVASVAYVMVRIDWEGKRGLSPRVRFRRLVRRAQTFLLRRERESSSQISSNE